MELLEFMVITIHLLHKDRSTAGDASDPPPMTESRQLQLKHMILLAFSFSRFDQLYLQLRVMKEDACPLLHLSFLSFINSFIRLFILLLLRGFINSFSLFVFF